MKLHLNAHLIMRAGMAVLLSLAGCGRQESRPPMPSNAVAVVGGQAITRETFRHEWTRRAQGSSGIPADPMAKQALLEELIRVEVLHQKALAAGYDKDPQIAANFKRTLAAKYLEDQLARRGQTQVSANDITDYYGKHPERFGKPEQARAALIEMRVSRTATPEKRAEMERKAAAVLAEAKAAASADGTFGSLAQNHSEDQASRYRGGDIGWLTVGHTNASWPPAVLAAISRLSQPGDFAPVIETPAAFYLVRLVERRPASLRPLEEVRAGIEYWVARDKEKQQQEALFAELKRGLEIRTNTALLEAIELPVQEPHPPGMPGESAAHAGNPAAK